jgi:hypothetical protein
MKTFCPQISADERGHLANLQRRAMSKGYALIGADLLGTQARLAELTDFLRHIERMPAEAYDDKITRRRFVTYAHYYKPTDFVEALLYFTEPEYDVDIGAKLFAYYLSEKYNPQPQGEVRKFAPVPDVARDHPLLHQLIEAGFHAVPLAPNFRKLPIEVEVQFIRYEPRRGTPAVGTPPTTHQDNDWAFCVFLLEWQDIDGPINAFVDLEHVRKPLRDVPEDKVLATLSLVRPLEGYCVEDTKIAHYVGPVRLLEGSEYGRRTIVILSYKPLVPLRPADVSETATMLRNEPELLAGKSPIAEEISTTVPRRSGLKARGTVPQQGDTGSERISMKRGLY